MQLAHRFDIYSIERHVSKVETWLEFPASSSFSFFGSRRERSRERREMCAAALNSRGCVYRCIILNSIQYIFVEGKSAFFMSKRKAFIFIRALCDCVLAHKCVRCNRNYCLHELLKFRRNGRRRRWNHFMRVKNTTRIEHVLHSLHEPNFFCVFPSPKFLNFHRP